jgi:hypothetical protein
MSKHLFQYIPKELVLKGFRNISSLLFNYLNARVEAPRTPLLFNPPAPSRLSREELGVAPG